MFPKFVYFYYIPCDEWTNICLGRLGLYSSVFHTPKHTDIYTHTHVCTDWILKSTHCSFSQCWCLEQHNWSSDYSEFHPFLCDSSFVLLLPVVGILWTKEQVILLSPLCVLFSSQCDTVPVCKGFLSLRV